MAENETRHDSRKSDLWSATSWNGEVGERQREKNKSVSRQDFTRLAGMTRCGNCREVGTAQRRRNTPRLHRAKVPVSELLLL